VTFPTGESHRYTYIVIEYGLLRSLLVSFTEKPNGYRVRPVALFVDLFREAQPTYRQAIRQTYKD